MAREGHRFTYQDFSVRVPEAITLVALRGPRGHQVLGRSLFLLLPGRLLVRRCSQVQRVLPALGAETGKEPLCLNQRDAGPHEPGLDPQLHEMHEPRRGTGAIERGDHQLVVLARRAQG